MDKKKVLAGVLVLVAGGVLSYVLLPGYFGGDEKPAAPMDDVAKIRAQAPKRPAAVPSMPSKSAEPADSTKEEAATGKPDSLRAQVNVMETPEPARAVLPPAPPAQAGDERRLHATLRDRDIRLVDHEYKRTLSKIEREEIEDEAALEKARTEADRVKAERAYLRANPSQLLVKSQGPGAAGFPAVTPVTSGPGGGTSSNAVPLDGYDQPTLRMISTVGNEKVAFIEYRGSLHRLKAGDSFASWKVKTVAAESVQISSGKTVKTLQFALPAGDSANSGTLPPPPSVTGAPRRPGST